MPQAFTEEQMQSIRNKLFESACRHAAQSGIKTSMEVLANDAGISKSTFYKFFESKEQLFLEVAVYFERLVIGEMKLCLSGTQGESSPKRTAAAVNAAFLRFAQIGVSRFFAEDIPLLLSIHSPDTVQKHWTDVSNSVLNVLKEEGICFSKPEETVLSVIQLLYRSIAAMAEVDHFEEAFRLLVLGVCSEVVE